MSLFKSLSTLALLLLVTACGFQPLYGEQTSNRQVTTKLAATYVMPIDGRVGQIVRNELLDRVSPKGIPAQSKYRLRVKLSERKQGLAIDTDDSTNRYNLTIYAKYSLLDSTGKEIIYRGTAQSIASYNVVSSDFANLSAEINARKRSALVVAEEIHRQLSVYLSR
ncbi:MAG: hypothetical protein JKY12_08875 [Sneathiella sp.]|nr:hypothetical protein [Sneathiella sp.]